MTPPALSRAAFFGTDHGDFLPFDHETRRVLLAAGLSSASTGTLLALWGYVARYWGNRHVDAQGWPYVYPSRERLAREEGVTRNTIGNHLSALEALGVIRRDKLPMPGQKAPNIYLCPVPVLKARLLAQPAVQAELRARFPDEYTTDAARKKLGTPTRAKNWAQEEKTPESSTPSCLFPATAAAGLPPGATGADGAADPSDAELLAWWTMPVDERVLTSPHARPALAVGKARERAALAWMRQHLGVEALPAVQHAVLHPRGASTPDPDDTSLAQSPVTDEDRMKHLDQKARLAAAAAAQATETQARHSAKVAKRAARPARPKAARPEPVLTNAGSLFDSFRTLLLMQFDNAYAPKRTVEEVAKFRHLLNQVGEQDAFRLVELVTDPTEWAHIKQAFPKLTAFQPTPGIVLGWSQSFLEWVRKGKPLPTDPTAPKRSGGAPVVARPTTDAKGRPTF